MVTAGRLKLKLNSSKPVWIQW